MNLCECLLFVFKYNMYHFTLVIVNVAVYFIVSADLLLFLGEIFFLLRAMPRKAAAAAGKCVLKYA